MRLAYATYLWKNNTCPRTSFVFNIYYRNTTLCIAPTQCIWHHDTSTAGNNNTLHFERLVPERSKCMSNTCYSYWHGLLYDHDTRIMYRRFNISEEICAQYILWGQYSRRSKCKVLESCSNIMYLSMACPGHEQHHAGGQWGTKRPISTHFSYRLSLRNKVVNSNISKGQLNDSHSCFFPGMIRNDARVTSCTLKNNTPWTTLNDEFFWRMTSRMWWSTVHG